MTLVLISAFLISIIASAVGMVRALEIDHGPLYAVACVSTLLAIIGFVISVQGAFA